MRVSTSLARMAAHTADEVEAKLDAAISWRRIELLALRSALEKAEGASPGSPLARALARGGVALVYAHWEGFFRDACQAYLDFVARRRLTYSELNDGFLLSALSVLLNRMSSGDAAAAEALLEALRAPARARARVPRSLVNTKSNLRHAVAESILGSVGLPRDLFALRAHLIDLRLCDARNEIAHGRERFPSASEFAELHDEAVAMMEVLRGEIGNALQSRHYRYDDQNA